MKGQNPPAKIYGLNEARRGFEPFFDLHFGQPCVHYMHCVIE